MNLISSRISKWLERKWQKAPLVFADILVVLLSLVLIWHTNLASAQTPTPTVTPIPEESVTPTAISTLTPSPTPTVSPTPMDTPTNTPTPSSTPTDIPPAAPTLIPTVTLTPSPTPASFHFPYDSESKVFLLAGKLNDLFKAYINYPTNDLFGAYVIEPAGDKLYIGLSAGSPGNYDGALLAKYENEYLTAVTNNGSSPISEQGLHDMTFSGGTLYIAGTDPCCPDGWEMGNVYSYIPRQEIVKHRNLRNVLHTLGLWMDPTKNILYAATGSHTGDNKTWVGEVFKSTDGANSWQVLSSPSNYRVFDIIGLGDKLYATSYGNADMISLKQSLDDGQTWQDVDIPIMYAPNIKTRLIVFKDYLVYVTTGSKDRLYTISKDGSIRYYKFPAFKITNWWNVLANANNEYLYAITEDQRIVRTVDFSSWYEIAKLDTQPISLTYWQEKNILIAGSQGQNAQLWGVNPAKVDPIPIVTPTPIPYYYYSFGPNGTPSSEWNTAKKISSILKAKGENVQQILNWRNDTASYEFYFPEIDFGTNFDIVPGKGYLIVFIGKPKVDIDAIFNNYTPIPTYTYVLNKLNLISIPETLFSSIPSKTGQVTAEDLCISLNSKVPGIPVPVIHYLYNDLNEPGNSQYLTHACYFDAYEKNNFSILSGQAYFIRVDQEIIWKLEAPIPTSTPIPTLTPTPTDTPTPTPTNTPTPTPTNTPTPTPTNTPTPTSTPTPTPTNTPTPTKKPTSTPTPTPKMNSRPVIVTKWLPAGRVNRSYTAIVEGYDLDTKDNLTMKITNLPYNLTQSSCQQSVTGNRKTIRCTISGIPKTMGIYLVRVFLSDQKSTVVNNWLPLIIVR